MFIPMIAAVISLLVIVAYMSSSSLVVDTSQLRIAFEKMKYTFSIEKVIAESVESFCQEDPATCKSFESSGVITLTMGNIASYLPANFNNDNLLGGNYSYIEIYNNYSTIRITHNVPSDISRKVYLNHYAGKEFGIPPKCHSGSETTSPPCLSEVVEHNFPTSLETRAALQGV